MELVALIVWAVAWGVTLAIVAPARGRSGTAYFFYGALFGPFALVVLLSTAGLVHAEPVPVRIVAWPADLPSSGPARSVRLALEALVVRLAPEPAPMPPAFKTCPNCLQLLRETDEACNRCGRAFAAVDGGERPAC